MTAIMKSTFDNTVFHSTFPQKNNDMSNTLS